MKTVKAYEPIEQTTLTVKIDGLREIGDGVFELKGVDPVSIDYQSVVDLLKLAGVDEKDAYPLTDEFSGNVFRHTLARQLAARISAA